MSKHTPGPWIADTPPNRGGWWIVRDAGGLELGSGVGVFNQDDARLIAAAPELMDACLAMVEWDAREQDCAVDFYARIELCRIAFNKVRSAIAKATGEV